MRSSDMCISRLREMFEYDPDTGILTWRSRPESHFKSAGGQSRFNARYAGKPTGYLTRKHLVTNIGGTPILVHRIAWAIYYGVHPTVIDHKNLDGTDNRLANLRECTMAENQHNRGRNKNNTSGFKGVSWHPQTQKWRAYIVLDYKQKHLGLFGTPEEAHEAFKRAANDMHGSFANHG